MLFPYSPSYRELIYKKMDEEFDIDWFFCGDAKRPLKLMDYSFLKRCDLSMSEQYLVGSIHRYKGIRKLNLGKYDAIITAPVIRCTSIWWLVWKYGSHSKGPKIYFWTHGWYGRESKIATFIKKMFLKKADGFFLYNNRGKSLMKEQGFDISKLFVIYNSLNYDVQLNLRETLKSQNLYKDYFGNNNRTIVFIGRLIKEKRFDLLIEALALLKQRNEFYNMVLIGDGSEREQLEDLVARKGLSQQVWFYGACFDENTNANLIYNADICVSPGEIGLTAIHVLMFGCPAITNDNLEHQGPEFEAIKPGVTGGFFKPNDYISLADSISDWFVKHSDDREVVRQECYQEIDSHWNPEYQIQVLKDALSL